MRLRFGIQTNVAESGALDICLPFSIPRLFCKMTVFNAAGIRVVLQSVLQCGRKMRAVRNGQAKRR
jgi:hypothetical protein